MNSKLYTATMSNNQPSFKHSNHRFLYLKPATGSDGSDKLCGACRSTGRRAITLVSLNAISPTDAITDREVSHWQSCK